MRILIADDDAVTLTMLERSLTLAGHEVRLARDGQTAWEMYCNDPCRMVISDWVMPGLDGVSLCRRIREAKLPQYTFVILITSWGRELDVVETLSAGADDVLTKPFNPAELRVRVYNAERVLNLEELSAAERALQDINSRLRGIFTHSRDAILIIDPERDRIVDVNPAACQLLERSHEELLALKASQVHSERNGKLLSLLRSLQLQHCGATEELHCRAQSGRVIPTEASASLIQIDGRECLLAVVRDISERKRAELQLVEHMQCVETANRELLEAQSLLEKKNQRLRELYRMAHMFVDNVSHEFRTPLTVIKEYAALIAEEAFGPVGPEQQRFLNVIGERADDLNTMVDDMLDASKLDMGMMGVHRRQTNVARIVEHVRPLLERKGLHREVALEFEIEADLPDVYVDEEKVGRILINLAINAIKFSGEQGHVRIWARREPASTGVVIGVTDNGPGIDPDRQREIFERFKQLGTGVRGSCKGFGLGLNIARELVDLNLGTMDLKSEVGVGTTFSFTLPPAVPIAIVARYLDRACREIRPATPVSILIVQVIEPIDDELADAVDATLGQLLQRNDLLLRAEPRTRLILSLDGRVERERMLQKLANAQKNKHGGLPGQKLPAMRFEFDEAELSTDDREAVSLRVAGLLRPAPIGLPVPRAPTPNLTPRTDSCAARTDNATQRPENDVSRIGTSFRQTASASVQALRS